VSPSGDAELVVGGCRGASATVTGGRRRSGEVADQQWATVRRCGKAAGTPPQSRAIGGAGGVGCRRWMGRRRVAVR
jgi:hypothetical protein